MVPSKTPESAEQPPSATETTTPTDSERGLESSRAEQDVSAFPKLKKQITLEDQQQRMPFRQLLVVYSGVGIALILSFMDQTSVTTAAPVIGTDLNGSESISWVGTAYYVSNCACHMVYGRMSDIFGRKVMLAIATAIMAFGNLLCGFAKTPVELYIFRAIAGMGGQGINSIAMVVVSDIVSLKDRGKYQGLVAGFAFIGNAAGPFLGGTLAGAGHWPWVFWTMAIFGAVVIVLDWLILPLKPVHGSVSRKLKQIDYIGIFLSAALTVFLLVPISGGGSTFSWDGATVIAMLVVGGICALAFIWWEWKVAKLPILPMRIFNNRNSVAVQIQSFMIGVVYYGNAFYVPIYLQYVRRFSPFKTATYVLAQTLPGSIWGIVSGFYISKTGHYKYCIIIGGVALTLGIGLQILWGANTPTAQVLGCLQITTLGVGWNMQTTLVAALATSKNADRAVVTSSRNFFRTMGAAFGLAMANAIYNNRVSHQLATIPGLAPGEQKSLLSSALSLDTVPNDIQAQVIDAYLHGVRAVFITFTALAGLVLLCALCLKEVPFRKDSPELEAEKRRWKEKKSLQSVAEAGNVQERTHDESQDEKAPQPDRRGSTATGSTLADPPLETLDEVTGLEVDAAPETTETKSRVREGGRRASEPRT